MADFCMQCSIEMFGRDTGDLAHLRPDDEPLKEGYGYLVLCEGCGATMVNELGECIAKDCLKKHGVRNETKRS